MKIQAHYNRSTRRSTFSRPFRNSDMRPDAKIYNDAPKAIRKDLANKKGTSAAGRILYETH